MPIFARLKPQAPRQGFPLLSCTYQGMKFDAGGPARAVSSAQAEFLRTYREVETDPSSPLAFDVWEGTAEQPAQAAPEPLVPRPTPQPKGPITTAELVPPKPAKRPPPPTLEQVLEAGYSREAAEHIVERERRLVGAGCTPYGDGDRSVLEVKVEQEMEAERQAKAVEQPPVDNDHVEPGAEQFTPKAISQAAVAAAEAPESEPQEPLETPPPEPEPDIPDPTQTPESKAAREAAEAQTREQLADRQPVSRGRYRRR